MLPTNAPLGQAKPRARARPRGRTRARRVATGARFRR